MNAFLEENGVTASQAVLSLVLRIVALTDLVQIQAMFNGLRYKSSEVTI